MQDENKKPQEEKKELDITISGKMVYEIHLKEKSYKGKYEVCNENNLIALMMVKELVTYLVERNSNPNIPKALKIKGEKFRDLCKSAIVISDLAEQIGGHIIKEAENGKYKPEIIVPKKPRIIMP